MATILQSDREAGWRGAAPAAVAIALIAATACQSVKAEATCLAGAVEARGATMADARTLVLEDGRMLRIAGVESFALILKDADAAESALHRRLQEIVSGSALRVRLLSESPDRYGRFPAVIADADGRIVQEVLAREGLAVAFASGDSVPCFQEILAAEDQARRSRVGFWDGIRLPRARPDELRPLIGRFAIFEGVVISVGNRTARTYLNFGGLWTEDVTVEIEARDRETFGGEAALAGLAGKRMRVRGFVEEKAGPMALVRSPSQLEILGEAFRPHGEIP
jgi:hypothetical protein